MIKFGDQKIRNVLVTDLDGNELASFYDDETFTWDETKVKIFLVPENGSEASEQ